MVRFLADASLHHAIVTGCARREPAIDFLSAQSAKLDGMSDPDVLGIAASQGRILVTHDFRTMPKHFAEFLAAGGSSPGVFLVKQQTPLRRSSRVLYWSGRRQRQKTGRIELSRSRCVESRPKGAVQGLFEGPA